MNKVRKYTKLVGFLAEAVGNWWQWVEEEEAKRPKPVQQPLSAPIPPIPPRG